MMLTFTKFESRHSGLIENWLKSDVAGLRFIPSYAKTEDFIHLIDFGKRYLWIIENDNAPIGFFDFEIEDEEIGYFVIYLAVEFRGKGLGSVALHQALGIPELKKVKIMEGGVEKDNEASKKTLEQVGFKYKYTDEDGMLMYQIKLSDLN